MSDRSGEPAHAVPPQLYLLYQQLGENTSTLRTLEQTLRDLHGENKQRFGVVESELRNVKHEGRNHQQIVNTRLDRVEVETAGLKKQVERLERPVQQMVRLRARFAAIWALLLSISGVAWLFAEPLWHFAAERLLEHFAPPRH